MALLRGFRHLPRHPDRRGEGLPRGRLGVGPGPDRPEDGDVEERASSHHGYNYRRSAANLVSDAGIGPLRDVAETVGARAENGWGPETGLLLVSGGSHAGNLGDEPGGRYTPAAAVHLVPLEPIAAADSTTFAISPPWLKQVWRDPEAEGTD